MRAATRALYYWEATCVLHAREEEDPPAWLGTPDPRPHPHPHRTHPFMMAKNTTGVRTKAKKREELERKAKRRAKKMFRGKVRKG